MVLPSKMLSCRGGCGMGGDLVHIKAFKLHPLPHQSDVFTQRVLVRGHCAMCAR